MIKTCSSLLIIEGAINNIKIGRIVAGMLILIYQNLMLFF